MRKINHIIVHCTANKCDYNSLRTNIDRLKVLKQHFKSLGWKSPGYHVVVMPDGEVCSILPVRLIANGAHGYNKDSIHISYFGGYTAADNTPIQINALMALAKFLQLRCPGADIIGHTELPNVTKDCPNLPMFAFRRNCKDLDVSQFKFTIIDYEKL